MAIALYIDESFPKATGLFGANAAGRGRVRLKHRSDVLARFAAGEVPLRFDALAGTELPLDHKGPPLVIGADAVWEWGGTNAPGYGDPLDRAPERVAHDVAVGELLRDDASRIYGVALRSDGSVDADATQGARHDARSRRLARAVISRRPTPLPPDARLRPLGGGIALVDVGGEPYFASEPGRVLLGRAAEGYRLACAVVEEPIAALGDEFFARAGRPGDAIVFREYLCPVTGSRLDAEIARRGDRIDADIVLAGERRATRADR
jgi:N-methylhydantoinase B